MDNSIHLPSKFSEWKRQFGFRFLGGNNMFTKGSLNAITYTRYLQAGMQTGRFARLVSLFKRQDKRPTSFIQTEQLEKIIRYTRPVDMGTLIRYR